MMPHIVFFLEERSAKAMLEGLLPRLLPKGVGFRCIVFEGKQDLERQLARRMRGYEVPGAGFMVLRDQDVAECRQIKRRILEQCRAGGRPDALVRIACRELESWYLADLTAVEAGLGLKGLAGLQGKRKFREPDRLHSPATELSTLTNGKYQKILGSRAIGPHLATENPTSNSFKAFIAGIRKILADFGFALNL